MIFLSSCCMVVVGNYVYIAVILLTKLLQPLWLCCSFRYKPRQDCSHWPIDHPPHSNGSNNLVSYEPGWVGVCCQSTTIDMGRAVYYRMNNLLWSQDDHQSPPHLVEQTGEKHVASVDPNYRILPN